MSRSGSPSTFTKPLERICSNYIHEYCPEQRTDGCPNAEKCGMFTPLRRKKTYEE